ncbi:DUF4105 domain-containing protein [Lacihabitans sp. LS3-19]|uniref:Lnb N-terminal periplasmic domain-containing protein n=1 Tax=Lacihabitans sp. LS3-19 TaxID=2487335 RepID=UPI0020CC943D|nr:DUF4105 domain-containing protein [Lacihabitans sp. LS3-19]MCP9769961.1 DUF4105 domain-containing protein [Lacihabitans sp. LS3-19]
MKKLLFLFLFITSSVWAQTLSDQSRVSLLTISPGEELYSTFGHSAIRIVDPQLGIDVNFNYGTFNFNAPNFYIKFLRGQLPYQISAHDFYLEMNYWANQENRGVKEQGLNLTLSQKQKVFDFLQNNLLPENREYNYKFFTDNCSTRLRDVFQQACGDSLVFDKQLKPDSTFRQWIDKYAINNNKPWADFAMDLAIGVPSDRKTGWSDAMFLPDNLMFAANKAKILKNGAYQPFVLGERDLNYINPIIKEKTVTPFVIFSIFFFIIAGYTFWQFRKKSKFVLFDKVFFTILGISGWILFLLWFFTDHGVTEKNFNLVWAFPLLFPIAFFIKNQKIAKPLFLFYGIINILLLLLWKVIPQEISIALIPIILTILIRIAFILKNIYGFKSNS